MLCVGVGFLVPVGWVLSGLIDSFLAARSEVFLVSREGRYIAQILLVLMFVAIGCFLMALTGMLVSRLRDLNWDRSKAPPHRRG